MAICEEKHLEKHDIEKTILIAEDDFISYKLLSCIVGATGVKVIWAMNGAEAVEICTENQDIDLVFMDISMPEMDGFEATSKIKELRNNLPIIIQSSFVDVKSIKKGFDSGCDEYINKPIDKNIIYTLLNKYLVPAWKRSA